MSEPIPHPQKAQSLARCRALTLACSLLASFACTGLAEDDSPPAAPSAAEEWRHYAQDPGGRRFSPLDQIHTGNIDRLERAWTYRTGDIAPEGAHYFECTPLVVDGVMYVITTFSRLVALDATTGKQLWSFDPSPALSLKETGAGGLASRGVAYWEDGDKHRIFLPVRDGRLYSIDTTTGSPDPEFGDNGLINLRDGLPHDGSFLFLSSPPTIYRNALVQPFGINDEPSAPARTVPLRAFDVRSGELLWSFNTVPQAGQFGVETWEAGSWAERGGCNPWSIISLDPERGIFYVPTGAPNNDKYGGDRHGDNLFANCIVALDALSGERLWHFQTVRHDLWDYDLPAMPNVVDLSVDGRPVPAVAVAGKTGFVYLFNRFTGSPVFPIEDQPVPASDIPGEKAAPTQPMPTKPPPFARQHLTEDELNSADPAARSALAERLSGYRSTGIFTPPSKEGTVVFPGQLGGANWSGASVDADGMMYVTSNELPYISALQRSQENPFGWDPKIQHFRGPDGLPASAPPWGTLSKIDLNRGELVWQKALGNMPGVRLEIGEPSGTLNFGGATTTAGGLVFIAATMDEKFRAFDSETGELLLSRQLEAGGYGAPITYLGRDGKQYVAICAGGGGKAGTPRGDYVIAFALPASTAEGNARK